MVSHPGRLILILTGDSLLWYDAMQSGRRVPKCYKNVLPSLYIYLHHQHTFKHPTWPLRLYLRSWEPQCHIVHFLCRTIGIRYWQLISFFSVAGKGVRAVLPIHTGDCVSKEKPLLVPLHLARCCLCLYLDMLRLHFYFFLSCVFDLHIRTKNWHRISASIIQILTEKVDRYHF